VAAIDTAGAKGATDIPHLAALDERPVDAEKAALRAIESGVEGLPLPASAEAPRATRTQWRRILTVFALVVALDISVRQLLNAYFEPATLEWGPRAWAYVGCVVTVKLLCFAMAIQYLRRMKRIQEAAKQ
jgi:TRAP-type C4-dicarboxylate transport system permease small subunit